MNELFQLKNGDKSLIKLLEQTYILHIILHMLSVNCHKSIICFVPTSTPKAILQLICTPMREVMLHMFSCMCRIILHLVVELARIIAFGYNYVFKLFHIS